MTDAVTTLHELLRNLAEQQGEPLGVLIVDHGSRRQESNDLLLELVELFRNLTGMPRVEPAHMELAAPTIAQAFDRLVAAGARRVVVLPFFLAPGRHWSEDIPRLAAEAAAKHVGVRWQVAAPMGASAAVVQVLASRLVESLRGPA
ncbi:MAG: hypothetical protein KDA37_14205 [Planctomycetales bacterium]|nr:hypothetical protein [Planctomycetales bacterium]